MEYRVEHDSMGEVRVPAVLCTHLHRWQTDIATA